MKKNYDYIKFNMYLLPLFLGLIAFLQSDLIPSGTSENVNLQKTGIDLFTMIFILLGSILTYSTLPKKNLFLHLINKTKKKKIPSDSIIILSEKIDITLSYIVYYIFMGLFITFAFVGVFVYIGSIQV